MKENELLIMQLKAFISSLELVYVLFMQSFPLFFH